MGAYHTTTIVTYIREREPLRSPPFVGDDRPGKNIEKRFKTLTNRFKKSIEGIGFDLNSWGEGYPSQDSAYIRDFYAEMLLALISEDDGP